MIALPHSPAITGALLLGGIVFGLWGNQLMGSSRTPSAKKRLMPAIALGVAILFLALLASFGIQPALLLVFALVVFAILAIQKQRARFCPGCGLSSFNDPKLAGADFCPRCGTKLER